MAILNLRRPTPPEPSGPDGADADPVASVQEMLASETPPGFDRIRRFVVRPRLRLWRIGVGIWLWIRWIGRALGRLVRWIARLLPRLSRALRFTAFLGRRAQNFGASIGAVGRNWSSAHGRLGGWGDRLTRFGGRLVGGGASLTRVGDGGAVLTKAASRFLEADSGSEAAAAGAPPGPGETLPAETRPARTGGRRPVARPRDEGPEVGRAPPPRVAPAKPSRAPLPQPAPPALARTPGPPVSGLPVPDPVPLPDDLPFPLANQIRGLGQRPGRDRVERLILEITEVRGWTAPKDLAAWLGLTLAYLSRRYLTPMTQAGRLVRRYPHRPTHPDQAYRSARGDGAAGRAARSE